MPVSDFFNRDDGLTVTGEFLNAARTIEGYFDTTEVDPREDGDIETAQFICERTVWLRATEGDTLRVPEGDFTINKVQPDGTGLAILTLLKGE